jgi:hypothetical protein
VSYINAPDQLARSSSKSPQTAVVPVAFFQAEPMDQIGFGQLR